MIRTDLGPVSAYALAVEYAQYTGTVEEFAQLQANSANNAAAAAASAAAAAAAANSVNISDINQSFALEENWVLTYESSDLIQGGYNADGSVNAQGTNYLRTPQMIPVYNGMSMYFKGGDVINRMKAGYFDPVTRRLDSSKDIPWMTGEQTVIFGVDGLIIPLFRRFDNAETQPSEFDAEFELISATKTKIDDRVLYSHHGDSASGDIDSNTMLECGYETQTRKNQILSFHGKIPSGTTFNNLEIGLKSWNNYYNKVVIDGTNVAFTVGLGNVITQAHGLTIANNIQVTIHTFVDNKATVRITSNGSFVDLEFGSYQQWRSGKAYAKSSQTLTNCTLSWANTDIAKRIWFFGDSYTAYASNRWPYYAGAWIGNILLDGYGGQASAQAISAFGRYLNCGYPEFAVFATGMNDGNDTNINTPNANWLSAVEGFLNTCKQNTIVPILCTIPTTPVYNNNAKNQYVRTSGHRYIDFAKAVGADGTGAWYAGMLGDDNIHPTVAGAKALCAQIEVDLPEVLIDANGGVDKTLTVSNMAADAKAVGDALAGKVNSVPGKGLSANDYTTAEKTKLSGIEAQANRVLVDSTLTQTGQAADAKAVGDALAEKVDTEAGKGLSSNDYTTTEKTKLAGIADQATHVVIDSTLEQSGQAADAKAVGDEIGVLKEDLGELPDNSGTDAENVDLDITDENGNSIVRFANGGIQTKDFNSSELKSEVEDLTDTVEGVAAYEVGKNLVDPDKKVDGGIQSNGTILTTDTWSVYGTSDYIMLDDDTDYAFSIFNYTGTGEKPAGDQRLLLLLFDENKSPITSSYQNVSNAGTLTFNSGSDAKYVRVSGRKSYNFQLVKGTTTGQYIPYDGKNVISMPLGVTPMGQAQCGNVLFGKKWAVCGDSFSAGATSTKITSGRYVGRPYVYPYLIANRNNMEILKFFNGGQTLAFPAEPGTFTNSLTYPSGANYYQNIPEDVDYITIYLGINDANHSSGSSQDGEETTGYIPLGEITDATTASYYGAWNVVLTWLISNRPHAHIGIIVTNGNSNDDYRQAQIAIAKKYGLPYIDLNGDERTPSMHRTSNPDIASAVKTALLEKWRVSSSNTHPNDAAHLFESTFIENFLRSI